MNEFADASLGDRRLTKRLCQVVAALAEQPDGSIPQATGSWGQACGAYRFFDNDRIKPSEIVASHRARTVQRSAGLAVVLAVSDTTALNFGERPSTAGLGPIRNRKDKTLGLWAHSCLVFAPDGSVLGLIDAQCWARDPSQWGSRHHRHERSIEDKESAKWLRSFEAVQAQARQTPATRWVMIADREADLYELFALAQEPSAGAALLVRARHDRRLAAKQGALFGYLARAPRGGELQVTVPRRAGQAARVARVEVRFTQAQLAAPVQSGQRQPLSLWAVQVREMHPPKGVSAIDWQLLTTLPVTTWAEAVEKVKWYCVRWGIEVFHKVLKSGCRVEEVQLQTAERLQRYLMLKLVVAWRVMALMKLGRTQPQAPLSEALEAEEWQVLRALRQQRGRSWGPLPPSDSVPTMVEGVQWVARLGGHLGRRGDGPPGPLTLARGLERLLHIVAGWRLAHEANQCA